MNLFPSSHSQQPEGLNPMNNETSSSRESDQLHNRARLRPTLTYSVPNDLMKPQELFLKRFTRKTMLDLLSDAQIYPIVTKNLSRKVFLGGVPVNGNEVSVHIHNSLQSALLFFGPVKITWPNGIVVGVGPSSVQPCNFRQGEILFCVKLTFDRSRSLLCHFRWSHQHITFAVELP